MVPVPDDLLLAAVRCFQPGTIGKPWPHKSSGAVPAVFIIFSPPHKQVVVIRFFQFPGHLGYAPVVVSKLQSFWNRFGNVVGRDVTGVVQIPEPGAGSFSRDGMWTYLKCLCTNSSIAVVDIVATESLTVGIHNYG